MPTTNDKVYVKVVTKKGRRYYYGYVGKKKVAQKLVRGSRLSKLSANEIFSEGVAGKESNPRLTFNRNTHKTYESLVKYEEVSDLKKVKYSKDNQIKGKAKKLPGKLIERERNGQNIKYGSYVVTCYTKNGVVSGRSKMFNKEGVNDINKLRASAYENFFMNLHSRSLPSSTFGRRGRQTDSEYGEVEEGKDIFFNKLTKEERDSTYEGVVYYKSKR